MITICRTHQEHERMYETGFQCYKVVVAAWMRLNSALSAINTLLCSSALAADFGTAKKRC